MKIRLKSRLPFPIIIALCSACAKQENTSGTHQAPHSFNSIETLFASKVEPSQTFVINTNTGGTLTGNHGTRVTFPAGCFEFEDGTGVTGNVTVTLREVFSTSQMIFTGVLPVSEGIPLNCGGEFFLSASQNNSDVCMKNGMMMEISVPAQALDNSMQLFIDSGTNDDVVD